MKKSMSQLFDGNKLNNSNQIVGGIAGTGTTNDTTNVTAYDVYVQTENKTGTGTHTDGKNTGLMTAETTPDKP